MWLSCPFPVGDLEGVPTPPSWEVAGEASGILVLGSGSSGTWKGVCSPHHACSSQVIRYMVNVQTWVLRTFLIEETYHSG